MYRGKDEQRPAGQSATTYPVIRLTEPAEYHGKKHLLALDNWYTGIDICQLAKAASRLMDVVGTVKANRQGLPKTKLFPKTGAIRKSVVH